MGLVPGLVSVVAHCWDCDPSHAEDAVVRETDLQGVSTGRCQFTDKLLCKFLGFGWPRHVVSPILGIALQPNGEVGGCLRGLIGSHVRRDTG